MIISIRDRQVLRLREANVLTTIARDILLIANNRRHNGALFAQFGRAGLVSELRRSREKKPNEILDSGVASHDITLITELGTVDMRIGTSA